MDNMFKKKLQHERYFSDDNITEKGWIGNVIYLLDIGWRKFSTKKKGYKWY